MTTEQRASFERDGFVLISGLFTPDQIEAAREAIELSAYGKRFDDYLADRESSAVGGQFAASAGDNNIGGPNCARSQFPTGIKALDSLIECQGYLDSLGQCLDTEEPSYCNGHLFVREGTTDHRFSPESWQGFHIDNHTCSMMPPHRNWQKYAYVNSWVFLSDIEPDGAPLTVIPGSHRQLSNLLPDLIRDSQFTGGCNFPDIRNVPGLARAVPVTGSAGDALFYSSYLIHAAISFANRRRQRAVWGFSAGRRENDGWCKYSNAWSYSDRAYFAPFLSGTSDRVRRLFGWPAGDDPYYTTETLELLSAWYPPASE